MKLLQKMTPVGSGLFQWYVACNVLEMNWYVANWLV